MNIDSIKKYFEDVEILQVEYDIEETEPSILVRAKGKTLYCFYPDMREKFLRGKKYNVLFDLATVPDLKIGKACKYIKPKYWDQISFTTSYTICGEVVDLISTGKFFTKDGKSFEMFNSIIDCGIYVLVGLPYYFNTKIGDYIQAEGRLDIYTIEDLMDT